MHLANALHNDLIALHVVRLLILESTSPPTRSGKRCWTAIMHRQSTDHRGISALVTLIKERVIFQTQIVIILFIFSPSRYRESLYTNNVSYLLNQLLWNSSLQDSKLYEKSAASVLKNILEPISSSWLTSTPTVSSNSRVLLHLSLLHLNRPPTDISTLQVWSSASTKHRVGCQKKGGSPHQPGARSANCNLRRRQIL